MTNQIHPLFPTAIYQCKVDGHEEWKELLLSKTEHQFDPNTKIEGADGYHLTGEARGKGLMHKDEDFLMFFTEIADNIRECLEGAGVQTSMHELQFMKSWYTIKEYSDSMGEHFHACADLSFVYYVDLPVHSGIIFAVDKSPNEYFGGIYDPKASGRSHIHTDNFINSRSNYIPVEEGDLLVFPGSLSHTIPKESDDTGTHIRSVAGDIKISLKKEYIDLETGLIHPSHWRTF